MSTDKKDNSQELSDSIISEFELQYRLREARERGEKSGYHKGIFVTLLASIVTSVLFNKAGINLIDVADKTITSAAKNTKRAVKNVKSTLDERVRQNKNTTKK